MSTHVPIRIFAAMMLSAGIVVAQQGSKAGQAGREKLADKTQDAASTRGKALYARHCEICHYAQAEAMKMGAGLKGIYKKGKYSDGKKVDDASMRLWIEKGGPKMPPFRDTLNDLQIRDLIAYIRTL